MRLSLFWKLLAVNLMTIALVASVTWVPLEHFAAVYFSRLMEEYHIAPNDAHQMFLDAVRRSFVWATSIAVVVAGGVGYAATRTVLRPLRRMAEVARSFAGGNHSLRAEESGSGEVAGLGAAFNEMADRLQQLQVVRRTTVLNLAHELRTPLTNVRGYLEALIDGVVMPSGETFRSLQDEVMRLIALSEDLLKLAMAEASRRTLRAQPVDLRVLADEAISLFRVRLEAKPLTVQTAYDPNAGIVRADPEKLTQVFANLIENALQYSAAGGTVRLTVERFDDGCRVTVANRGEGISAEDLPFLFERFFRVEKSRSRESGGVGIGLAIVKELVEAHGGRVGAESTGEETRIWFSIPHGGRLYPIVTESLSDR
jgi:signal transduction histidine kinase